MEESQRMASLAKTIKKWKGAHIGEDGWDPEILKSVFKVEEKLRGGTKLTLNEFQFISTFTFGKERRGNELLFESLLGLGGECGEVQDLLKKVVFHGRELDVDALEKELGDVLWYLAAVATCFGLDMGSIAAKNIKKLETRYPDGFSKQASLARADEK